MKKESPWAHQRKRRGRWIFILILAAPLAGLVFLIVRNNLAESPDPVAAPADTVPIPRKGIDMFDGKKFRVVQEPGPDPDAPPVESRFTYRLGDCFAIPRDEKRLVLRMKLDLEFDSAQVRKEIQERQNDLRVLVNLKISSRNLADIEVRSLRPVLIEEINGLLKTGKIIDLRFVDFRIERRLTEN